MTLKFVFYAEADFDCESTRTGGKMFELKSTYESTSSSASSTIQKDVNSPINFDQIDSVELRNFPFEKFPTVTLHRTDHLANKYWKGETNHQNEISDSPSSSEKMKSGNGHFTINTKNSMLLEGNVCAAGYDFNFFSHDDKYYCEMIPVLNYADTNDPETYTMWQMQGRPDSLLKRYGQQELE